MGAPGLLLSAGLGLLASASFLLVAIRLGERHPAPEARQAHDGFRAWWSAISLYAFLVGFLLNALAFAGWTPVRVFYTVRSISILALCVAVWSLGHSVTFLVTGWRGARAAWAAFVAATYVIVLWTASGSLATSVHVGAYETLIVYAPPPDPIGRMLSLGLLGLPQVGAALAYGLVARRIDDARARRRALLVSASLAAWLFAGFASFAQVDSLLVLARPILGLVAAACVLLAYAPPPAAVTHAWHAARSRRAEALARRVQDLV